MQAATAFPARRGLTIRCQSSVLRAPPSRYRTALSGARLLPISGSDLQRIQGLLTGGDPHQPWSKMLAFNSPPIDRRAAMGLQRSCIRLVNELSALLQPSYCRIAFDSENFTHSRRRRSSLLSSNIAGASKGGVAGRAPRTMQLGRAGNTRYHRMRSAPEPSKRGNSAKPPPCSKASSASVNTG
jgi:hypothetical protein